jgi:(R,R)-butanediol dehydrogenase/meso-butanediol dehydrogenase/diacetyl reductase
VVDAGPGAEPWRGRRVACGAGVSCGTCPWCRAGRTNLCARYYTLGLSTHGGLAQYVAASTATLCEVPAQCSDADAALAQPLAVGLHAVARSHVPPGGTVVVLGAGAIGSFMLAGLSGHDGPVIALDIDDERLATATTLGASETTLIDRAASPQELRDLLPGGAQVVIESSGVPGSAQCAFALAAQGGSVLLVGLTKAAQPVEFADVVLREVTIHTTVAHICDTDLPAALALLAERHLSSVLVDRVVPLASIVAEAFEPLAASTVRGKILVDPRDG